MRLILTLILLLVCSTFLKAQDDDKAGNSTEWSGTIEVKVDTSASLEELNSAAFSIYPNPVKDIFKITGDKQPELVQVFNSHGQLVKDFIGTEQYSIAELASGLYLVKINGQAKGIKVLKE